MRIVEVVRSGWILDAFRKYSWLEVEFDTEYDRREDTDMTLGQWEE